MEKEVNLIVQNNIHFIDDAEQAIYFFRQQNYFQALSFSKKVIHVLTTQVDLIVKYKDCFLPDIEVQEEYILSILSNLLQAQEQSDYVLLADLYELQVIPLFMQLQAALIQNMPLDSNHAQTDNNIAIIKEKNKQLGIQLEQLCRVGNPSLNDYKVEYTSIGSKTIRYKGKQGEYYLHSNRNPFKEGREIANIWYGQEINQYVIYGFGFGYHIKALVDIDEHSEIYIFENNIELLQLACMYMENLDWLLEKRVHLIYDPDFRELYHRRQTYKDQMSFVIYAPSLKLIKEGKVKEELEESFIQYHSIKNQLPFLNYNFRFHQAYKLPGLEELRSEFEGKNLYIIAGGPSLDKNYKKLKELGEGDLILSTGTVFKKLLKEGIRPNYVIITDAKKNTYSQIEGIEEETVPMIVLSTAYWGFTKYYSGKKYIGYQYGYDKAEQEAMLRGDPLLHTGGSVSTTAFDLGIVMRCSRIIFLGLDLALTNNYSHAEGVHNRVELYTQNLRKVVDIYGNFVYTTKNLDIYRKWLERRIEGIREIEFIDATEGGAKIKGMKIDTLSNVIRKIKQK